MEGGGAQAGVPSFPSPVDIGIFGGRVVDMDRDRACLARARQREGMLAGEPGWIVVHRVTSGGACTCARGAGCERPGKHPVAAASPQGHRSPVGLTDALGLLGSPAGSAGRLAAVLSSALSERVLDADSPRGLACLWRASEEVRSAWMVSRTPRGLHVWQVGCPRPEDRTASEANRVIPMSGGDVKDSGFVVWPSWPDRWEITVPEALGMLARRSGGVGGSDRLIGPSRARLSGGSGGHGMRGDPAAVHAGILRVVARAGQGERNNALNWAAWKCRGLVGDAGWPVSGVADSLLAAGLAAGLERGEVVRTVRSGLGIRGSEWRRS